MDKNIKLIIACEVFKAELEHLKDTINLNIVWIQHSLHDSPEELNKTLRQKIAEAETSLEQNDTIMLLFGNCGGALQGLSSPFLNITFPEVPDCIPILLGSIERYKKLQSIRPGTFYLNKAWIDCGAGPLNSLKQYLTKYGQEKGWKVARKMYKHYTHFALINNGCFELEPYKNHVAEACDKLDKIYVEEAGDLNMILAILEGSFRTITIPADLNLE